MDVLIIVCIAGVLCYFDIISASIFGFIAALSILWLYLGAWLYFKFGFLKCYYHDILGWHTPDDSPQWFDGLSEHAKCKHCGQEIMQDSQGNWF